MQIYVEFFRNISTGFDLYMNVSFDQRFSVY